MAEPKSLFTTRNRFACRNKTAGRFARGRRLRLIRAEACATLMLACVWFSAASLAAGQQPAEAATPTQPVTKAAPSQAAIELVNQGEGQMDRNDFAGAAAAFQKAIESAPTFADAHRGLGIALWRQGKLGAAWQEMNRVARLEPDSARAHYELGRLAGQIAGGQANSAAADTGL